MADENAAELRAMLDDAEVNLDATRAALAACERERDEAIRQARLSSLANTPEWCEARSPKQLAELMQHMGYADGDSGYTLRYLSYREMEIVRAALLAPELDALRTRLARAEAALRKVDAGVRAKRGGDSWGQSIFISHEFAREIAALAASPAAPSGGDEREGEAPGA